MAYFMALRCNPRDNFALAEVLSLGELEDAQRVICAALGLNSSQSEGRKTLRDWAQCEALENPIFAALNCFPASQLPEYGEGLQVPAPPEDCNQVAIHVYLLDEGGGHSAAERTGRSLLAQIHQNWIATVLSSDLDIRAAFSLLDNDPIHRFEFAESAYSMSSFGQQRPREAQRSSQAVFAPIGTEFDRKALSWFAYGAIATQAQLFLCDESVIDPRNQLSGFSPKPLPDRDMLLGGESYGSIIGVGREFEWGSTNIPLGHDDTAYSQVRGLLQATIGHYPITVLPRLLAAVPVERSLPDTAVPTRQSTLDHATAGQIISIIIPTRDGLDDISRCLRSIENTVSSQSAVEIIVVDNGSVDETMLQFLRDGARRGRFVLLREDCPFNWSYLNNRGAALSRGGIFLFLNDDVEFLSTDWDIMISDALDDPKIGAVGARLLYPDGTVQHAGIVMRPNSVPEHEGRGMSDGDPGPMSRWVTRRTASAVTGALLATRSANFLGVSGFDESLPVWFNDIDYCFKLRQAGRRIRYEPAIVGRHYESRTIGRVFKSELRLRKWQEGWQYMQSRWGQWMHHDPSYNPQFSSWGPPFSYICEPAVEEIVGWMRLCAVSDPWEIPIDPHAVTIPTKAHTT